MRHGLRRSDTVCIVTILCNLCVTVTKIPGCQSCTHFVIPVRESNVSWSLSSGYRYQTAAVYQSSSVCILDTSFRIFLQTHNHGLRRTSQEVSTWWPVVQTHPSSKKQQLGGDAFVPCHDTPSHTDTSIRLSLKRLSLKSVFNTTRPPPRQTYKTSFLGLEEELAYRRTTPGQKVRLKAMYDILELVIFLIQCRPTYF